MFGRKLPPHPSLDRTLDEDTIVLGKHNRLLKQKQHSALLHNTSDIPNKEIWLYVTWINELMWLLALCAQHIYHKLQILG